MYCTKFEAEINGKLKNVEPLCRARNGYFERDINVAVVEFVCTCLAKALSENSN
jgi:hypothetical protein